MPRTLSKSELLQLRLKGQKADDGSDLALDDENSEQPSDLVVNALSELGKQTGQMTAALTELNKIVGQSLISLADIVEEQSKSIAKLADGISKLSNKTEPVRKPRSYAFDIVRENGHIKRVNAKEINH